MTNFTPLGKILDENRLVGPNYSDWIRNLNIVLTAEKLVHVVNEAKPNEPALLAPQEEHLAYEKWTNDDSLAKCYILASLDNPLQKQHELVETSKEILDSLKEMFGQQNRSARQQAMKSLMSTKMVAGTPVRDHVMKMIGYINELDSLGSEMDIDTKVDAILSSLPDTFNQFVLNYNMVSMEVTLPELLNMLVRAEGLIVPEKKAVLVTEGGKSSKAKNKRKKFWNNKGKQAQGGGKTKKKKKNQKTDICHHCGKVGHWKRNCFEYLDTLKNKSSIGISDMFIIEINSLEIDSNSWCIDTGATSHVCNVLHGFQEIRRLNKGEVTLHMGTKATVAAVSVGTYCLMLDGVILTLKECLYVPQIRRNLISVTKLVESGYSFLFTNKVVIKLNNKVVAYGVQNNGLYFVNAISSLFCVESSNKRKRESVIPTYLWHLRLGHINIERINRLARDGPLNFLKVESFPTCEPCLQGKMTKLPFKGKGERNKRVLDLIHTDVCGPLNHNARGGYIYFITFTDDFSRYGYIYLMKHKSESFEKFKEFRNEVENQQGNTIKSLRSDRGGEYLSDEFKVYLKDNGITSQLSAPGTPQHNGVAERRNRTLLDMVRSMMSMSNLPISFWGYALETAIYLLNRVPTKSLLKTPYEAWTNKKPSVRHLKIWGCPAHVKKQSADKLESRTNKCFFVGYPKETIGYYFYNPDEQKVFVSRNAFFLEEEFALQNDDQGNKIILEERIENIKEGSKCSVKNDDSPTQHEIPIIPIRKSTRIIRPPVKLSLLNEQVLMISESCEKDPYTYNEALNDIDKDQWIVAMKTEMDSMYINHVWTLVDQPIGIKTIGCKWIYKRKRGLNGNVETYKARLVAKGYTQKEGIDYDETFSPVAMLKSIRALLAMAAHYDYEIWQMDVKTAFLNGYLNEDIYMDQPQGFISQGEEHKVCKLHKSIYGLKQASRSWNVRFDETIKTYDFIQNMDEPCVYKKIQGDAIVFLVLYVDDILLIGNNVAMLSTVKLWLSNQFSMKDLGEASFILGLKLYRDRSKRLLGLSQSSYIDKILTRFNMQDSKKALIPFRHGLSLSKDMSPKSDVELDRMRRCPYASAVGSLMYAMLCTRPDIAYAVGIVSKFQSNPGEEHWTAVKHILKYLRRTKDYCLVYGGGSLKIKGYTDSDFQADPDDRKSTSGYVFTLNNGAFDWRSCKQKTTADSTTEAEYIAASKAAKEAVWIKKFIEELEIVPSIKSAITLYCDNSGAIAQAKEPRAHQKTKHIMRKYHIVREIAKRGDVEISKIASAENMADPLTKPLPSKIFEKHITSMGLKLISEWL